MAYKGECIYNPVTGERVEFLQTAEDTDGGLLQIRMTMKPRGYIGPSLVHPVQDKRFEVESGSMHLIIGNEEQLLNAGENYLVPRSTPHIWWNSGGEELVMRMEFKPALQMEDFFTSLFALARAGKTNQQGVPNLLQSAVMSRKYRYEVFLAKPSVATQKALFNSIAWLGLLLGYHADYPYQHAKITLEPGRSNGGLATVPVEERCL
jgi:mannose-6-phosphate isomerase-like protein (cupin superfamily)